MTEDSLPYGGGGVNKALRPLIVLPFRRNTHKVWLTAEFLKSEDLSAEEKGLLGILSAYMDKSFCCCPTHPQLIKQTKMGHCKLEKMLKKLRKKELIWWDHFYDKWGHRRCLYRLIFYREMTKPTPTNQLLSTPSKAVGKHIAIDIESERAEEKIVKYGAK